MEKKYTLQLNHSLATLETVGGKGASLAKMANEGLPVPDGFHVTTEAYREFVVSNNLMPHIQSALTQTDINRPETLETASRTIREQFEKAIIPSTIANAILLAYQELPGINPAVAVRSSATAEDLPEASFAGQQETYLNVCGPDAILGAVKKCWSSLWTARAIGYRARQKITDGDIALAVVVQLLVPAESAGILFTANPLSGRRDQAVISAAWGLGEAVVSGLVTPDSFIIEKSTGRLLESQIAKKEVMTIRTNGSTQEKPVPASLASVQVLDETHAAELTHLAVQIEKLYNTPMDIEWAFNDGKFSIVQARPITTLPEDIPAPQIEWIGPDPKGQYIRTSIIDLMPDPLCPLFGTMGLTSITKGVGIILKDHFNLNEDLLPNFILTINGYAYEQVSFNAKQWWQMLTRMVPSFPRMLREGIPYWQNIAHPRYKKVSSYWKAQALETLSTSDLYKGINEVMAGFSHHLASLMTSTLGPSAGSEGLFTQVYNKLIYQEGDPDAPVYLMGFDNIPIKAEKALFDLAMWCQKHDELSAFLTSTPSNQITDALQSEITPAQVPDEDWSKWKSSFESYLENYGYPPYDLDFLKPLPQDEPQPLIESLKLFINGQGKNPYERQQTYTANREAAEQEARARFKRGFKRWAFEKSLKWAQTQAPLREDGIAEIGLGYPAIRAMLHELGKRFTAAGIISEPEDIYWLEEQEVKKIISGLSAGAPKSDFKTLTTQRKLEWKARKQVIPPPQIGKKFMGRDWEGVLATEASEGGNSLKGVPASKGQITAVARVLHGPEDFQLMNPGEILVAGITTPAWTPLFAMAGGVVTDIGGPLSHGSIVAREYGIPAVLGTGSATRRIMSGQTITVNGDTGVVTLINN